MLKIAASSGIDTMPPTKRGVHTRRTGSTAIISSAASWSVAFIKPIAEGSSKGIAARGVVDDEPALRRVVKELIDKYKQPALVEDLQQAMEARSIPFSAQNQMLARLAPMHREIIAP